MTARSGHLKNGDDRRWVWAILLLLFIVLACIGAMLAEQEPGHAQQRFVPIDLHSKLEADYQINPNPPRLAAVNMGIVWAAIADQGGNPDDLIQRRETVLNALQTPVAMADTPRCEGTYTIYIDSDTWLNPANPTANYGRDNVLQLGRDGDQLKRVLLTIPLNDFIPQGAPIYQARLEMTMAGGAAVNPPEVAMAVLNYPFSEDKTTWNNQPAAAISYRPAPLVHPDAHAWDVTDIVRAWLFDRYPNEGLMLESSGARDFNLVYYSREADLPGSQNINTAAGVGPRLIVECSKPRPETPIVPTTPTAPAVTPTGDIAALAPTVTPLLNTPTVLPSPSVELSPTPPPSPTPLTPSPTVPPTLTPLPTATPLPTFTWPPPTPTHEPPPTSTSTPVLQVDLVMSKTVNNPTPLEGSSVIYTLSVANNSTQNATGVVVTDNLPAGVTYVSNSGGYNNATGQWSVGNLAAGSSATLQITVNVNAGTTGSTINNVAAITAVDQADSNPGNNSASASITVTPELSINDVSLQEGNSGTTAFIFNVTLSAASSLAVSVVYNTADGTATLADNDYNSNSGVLNFPAGITTRLVTVTVIGDTTVESDETFFVNLSGPTNAVIADSQGEGAILNDDAGGCTNSMSLVADAHMITGDATNYGGDPQLRIKPNGSIGHALIQFDLSSVPTTTTITCAMLVINQENQTGGQSAYVHRVTASWVENQVNWANRFTGQPWATPGGDYNPAAETSFSLNVPPSARTIDIQSLVQNWVSNPSNNYGLLLLADNIGGETYFSSGESGNPPQLLIGY